MNDDIDLSFSELSEGFTDNNDSSNEDINYLFSIHNETINNNFSTTTNNNNTNDNNTKCHEINDNKYETLIPKRYEDNVTKLTSMIGCIMLWMIKITIIIAKYMNILKYNNNKFNNIYNIAENNNNTEENIPDPIIRPGTIKGKMVDVLLDTGGDTAYMDLEFAMQNKIPISKQRIRLAGAIGNKRSLVTEPVLIKFNGYVVNQKFVLLENMRHKCQIIAGRQLLNSVGISLTGIKLEDLGGVLNDNNDNSEDPNNHVSIEQVKENENLRKHIQELLETNRSTTNLKVEHPLGILDIKLGIGHENIKSNTRNNIR